MLFRYILIKRSYPTVGVAEWNSTCLACANPWVPSQHHPAEEKKIYPNDTHLHQVCRYKKGQVKSSCGVSTEVCPRGLVELTSGYVRVGHAGVALGSMSASLYLPLWHCSLAVFPRHHELRALSPPWCFCLERTNSGLSSLKLNFLPEALSHNSLMYCVRVST